MIPDETVERVRAEADPVSIIGEFVQLKRSGSSFRGPCPFHQGKDPNFSVNARGYHCFVCHEKGDVFTFIQKRLGLDFVDAVKWVGGRAGIEVREVNRRVEGADPREPVWELNTTAAEFFRERLWIGDSGAEARAYLASRGIDREQADRFLVGYAPRDHAMRTHLATLGFDDERQLRGGLLVRTDERPEPRPRFRNRLMFPIRDAGGHIVGFGGRVLGDGKPKYLNSAESEVFVKRELLYGLHTARSAARRAERMFVVEGYFDAIRLVLVGIEEVVAPLGTALTEAQAAIVKRFAPTAYLLYDSDRAGLKATFRSGDVLLASGVAVRVITLPAGEDPDTFAAKAGREGIEAAVERSVDVFDRKIQILERAGYFTDLRKKREALDKLLPTIRITADRLTRDLYIARTAEAAGVSRELLEQELAAPDPRAGPGRRPPAPARDSVARAAATGRARQRRYDHQARGLHAERELVRTLLHHRRFVELVAERIDADRLTYPAYRQIFDALLRADPDAGADALEPGLEPSAMPVLHELLEETGGLERADLVLDASLNALFARDLDRELADIDRQLPLADTAAQDELIARKVHIRRELTGLGRLRWKGFNTSQ